MSSTRWRPTNRCTRERLEHRDEALRAVVTAALGLERTQQLLDQLGRHDRNLELARRLADQPQIFLLEADFERRREIAFEDLRAQILKGQTVAGTAGQSLVKLFEIETGFGAEHEGFAGREQVDRGEDLVAELRRLSMSGRPD